VTTVHLGAVLDHVRDLDRGCIFSVTSSIHSRSSRTPSESSLHSDTTASRTKGASIAFTSSRLTASKYDRSVPGSFVFSVTSFNARTFSGRSMDSQTRRILRLTDPGPP